MVAVYGDAHASLMILSWPPAISVLAPAAVGSFKPLVHQGYHEAWLPAFHGLYGKWNHKQFYVCKRSRYNYASRENSASLVLPRRTCTMGSLRQARGRRPGRRHWKSLRWAPAFPPDTPSWIHRPPWHRGLVLAASDPAAFHCEVYPPSANADYSVAATSIPGSIYRLGWPSASPINGDWQSSPSH